MFTPFAYQGTKAAGGGLPAIYTTNLQQWFAPEAASDLTTYVTDQSGNGRDGSVSNPDSYLSYEATGVGLNYALQPITPENVINTLYEPNYKSAFTLQVWANITSTNSVPAFINNRKGSAVTDRFVWTLSGTNHSLIVYSGGSAAFNLTYTSPSSTWHLLTYTSDGSSDHRLYANLSQVNSSTSGIGASLPGVALDIGGQFKGNSGRWITDASIGSYKIYSEELTITEITTNYNAEKALYGL